MPVSKQQDLTGKLILAARLCRSLRARFLLAHGLYAGQDVLLKSLECKSGQSMGELAKNLGVRAPTITKMVLRMQAQGLLKRENSGFDNRLSLITMSAKGEALLEEIDTAWSRAENHALARLKARDSKRLGKILNRILAGFENLQNLEPHGIAD